MDGAWPLVILVVEVTCLPVAGREPCGTQLTEEALCLVFDYSVPSLQASNNTRPVTGRGKFYNPQIELEYTGMVPNVVQ